ncbi:enoyl-CoA hydratase [Reyranella sp. CPCC 100927]|uniref:enoyl-CoA hydratase n=1 Tax=Reyranella sp. CPCC 100927 TaxID=2599616 RepID=UPI0011B48C70|nr:enoyl-CoA hydratase [Reyranella sp. CPCC 100927]TWT10645.1 enoyl-CoA hydratase [Reyranella sp. CPCC 100927]
MTAAPTATVKTAAPASNEPVLLRQDEGRVAVLTLNRPQAMNALSGELIAALDAEFERLMNDKTVRVVVIQANGGAFSAGHDLREIRSSTEYAFHFDLVTKCSAMMMKIRKLPQPVIAKVHAVATAAGCQLVAACDLAVAASDAKFATPGVHIGLFCGTPSVPLGRNIGSKRALDMLFTGEPVSAETALRDGLVSRVVPPAELDAATMALAQHIATKSPLVLAQGKELFHKHMEMDLEQAYAYASAFMAGGMMREDAKIGIDAFVNKKAQPEWTGR